jgi:hypothetical protein
MSEGNLTSRFGDSGRIPSATRARLERAEETLQVGLRGRVLLDEVDFEGPADLARSREQPSRGGSVTTRPAACGEALDEDTI